MYTVMCTTCTHVHVYYTVLYYIILYYRYMYTVLYYMYTVLYYTVLYYIRLYCTILYSTVLYCTVLYYTVHIHGVISLLLYIFISFSPNDIIKNFVYAMSSSDQVSVFLFVCCLGYVLIYSTCLYNDYIHVL